MRSNGANAGSDGSVDQARSTVERTSSLVRPGCSCAFSIDLGEEQLVLVAEVARDEQSRDLARELEAIRAGILAMVRAAGG